MIQLPSLKPHQKIFILIAVILVLVGIFFLSNPATAAGGSDDPYFVAPNSDNGANYFSVESPMTYTVAIPGNYTADQSTKVNEVVYTVYFNDDQNPSFTFDVKNPRDTTLDKRLQLAKFTDPNGNDWTFISTPKVSTKGGFIYNDPQGSSYDQRVVFPSGLVKVFATITLHDNVTGKDTVLNTQDMTSYWLGG